MTVGNFETMAAEAVPGDRFDLVLALDVLEHLVDPWSAVAKIHRLLKPGGVVIASIPNVGHYSVVWPLIRGRWDYAERGLLDQTHLRFFTEASAKALITGSGLEIDRIGYNRPIPWRLRHPQLPSAVRSPIAVLWGKGPWSRFTAFQFMIRARAPLS
ncbi:MAG TPA: methyltransferase domain-containing protein [Stellaceae bacterium]|nr:methyltransferase domain-containing protein [Stellaceae bacterium]